MPEIVTRQPSQSSGTGAPRWWTRYRSAIANAGLTESALQVVELDCRYIVSRCVFGAGAPGADGSSWPASRTRQGLVIGSVQSGKTASMLGVAAQSLDRSVDIVVLLTGTRVALWRQTVDRTLEQLDAWSPQTADERDRARIMLPRPSLVAGRRGRPDLDTLYHVHPNRVRRSLQAGQPVIALVMKHVDHLTRFGNYLRDTLRRCFSHLSRPVHMLVIDDEADDGSILDAEVEAGLGPDSDQLKQIPRHIVRLWSDGLSADTFDQLLFATYIAYTATPQANILQSHHNPLSPTAFVVALRTPFEGGCIGLPRSTTFEEPEGLPKYYTGGEIYYHTAPLDLGAACCAKPVLSPVDFDDHNAFLAARDRQQLEMLGDALRAFFVAGAIRLHWSGKRLSTARGMRDASLLEVRLASPSPHTMLVHPSAAVDGHERFARLISAWTRDPDLSAVEPHEWHVDHEGRPAISAEGLATRLITEGELWRRWLDRFEASRQAVGGLRGSSRLPVVADDEWPQIIDLLRTEVFPHVRLAVINSHPDSDDRPQFSPVEIDGRPVAAPDLLSIFVSGNVMARGITLDGLTTTLFARHSSAPAADTQMQMQRWFGYRGSYVSLCRVFLFSDQLDLFRAYYENDEATRTEVMTHMNRESEVAPDPTVLQGAGFAATSKIANLGALPLFPGPQPFVKVVAVGPQRERNLDVLAGLLTRYSFKDLTAAGKKRGLVCERQLSLLEVAELLESMRYEHHDPDPESRNYQRWSRLVAQLKLEPPDAPLLRVHSNTADHPEAVAPGHCPFTIAAYLRLWSSALTRHARGLYPTDDHRTPWSMINLSAYAATAPKFYVGIRFGDAGRATYAPLAEHRVECMRRKVDGARVESTWGSRNPGTGSDAYLGDHLFDYHESGLQSPATIDGEPTWRPRGHPGLLLFHVIRLGEAETLTAGLSIPRGGPDHFAALRPTTGRGT